MRDFLRKQTEGELRKKSIPENALFYINQSCILTDLAMYHHNFIISQLIVAAIQLVEIDEYICKGNEVKLFPCMYDLKTGEFSGLRCEVVFIVLKGDDRELFLSYGFDTNKVFVLYSYSKQTICDAFISMSFKKHYGEIMNEGRGKEAFSMLFYHLPSITDRKEEINQHRNKVSLSSVFLLRALKKKKKKINLSLLNSTDQDLRKPQV